MASAEPEGEVFIANPPSAEPEAEGFPEPEGSVLTTMADALTTMVTNTTLMATKKKVLFFRGAALHWPSAMEAWGAAWPLHVYLSVLAFAALSVWAIIHVIRVLLARQMPGQAYYLALNFVISVCCPGRALRLFIDPYGTAKVLTKYQRLPMGAFMFPSITAAFILVFATLLRVTKMQIVSPRLFSAKMIVFVILLNYAVALTADTLAVTYANMAVMGLFCESYFVMWGIVASSAYFYVFRRLYIGTVVNRRKLNQIGEGGEGEKSGAGAKKEQELTTKLPVAAKITLVAAGCFLSISVLHIWRIATAVTSFLQEWERANHWVWFFYNTLLRLSEVLMCGTILFVGSLPFLSNKKK